MSTNRRETGARKLEPDHQPNPTDQNAALPDAPRPYGLTERSADGEAKTRHAEGVAAPKRPVPQGTDRSGSDPQEPERRG